MSSTKNNKNAIHISDQAQSRNFRSEPVTKQEVQRTRRQFSNQYNNAQYLVHPEKTYTQTILNLIFDPKPKGQRPVKASPEKYESAPVKNATKEQKSPQKIASNTKTNVKAQTLTATQQRSATGKSQR